MSRIVYSFSLPEESEAVWNLKQWKKQGRVLSHVIQKALECDARELHRLEKELEWEKKTRIRTHRILSEIFGVDVGEFKFYGTESRDPNKLKVHQPIEALDKARLKLKERHEWFLGEVKWE